MIWGIEMTYSEQYRMDKLLTWADSEPRKLCDSGAGRQWPTCLHQRNLFLGTVFKFRCTATATSLEPGADITHKHSLVSQTPFMALIRCVCRTLLQQLQKLQTLVMGKVSRTCKLAGTQTGTCLMVSFLKGQRHHCPGPLPNLQSLPSLPRPSAGGFEGPRSSLRGCFSAMM